MINYKDLSTLVRGLVNKHDPVGLVSGGAPEDEYSQEVSKLCVLLTQNIKESEFQGKVIEIFINAFDQISQEEEDRVHSLAVELYRARKSFID